ncbi:MAG TPA: DsbC family protein [Gammaproteobacteria bacterium]|jgi:thiol:disulfide interchange protein DsbC
MMKRLLVAVLALLAMPAMAAETKAIQQLKGELVKVFGTIPDTVNEAPIKGIYEVNYGPKTYYVSLDGRYLFSGDLYDLRSQTNLTEANRSGARLKALADVDESSLIVYKAKGEEKHVITVFTDIDCGYCRKLHSEMGKMNELGITVRYMAYPRAGVNSPSYDKAVSVWCAEDRNKAMDAAKSGKTPEVAKCDAPVKAHMAMGELVGVTGTPALILRDGSLMPGYMPAPQLAKALEKSGN